MYIANSKNISTYSLHKVYSAFRSSPHPRVSIQDDFILVSRMHPAIRGTSTCQANTFYTPNRKISTYSKYMYIVWYINIWCKYLAYMSCRIPNLLLQWLNDFSSGHQNTIKDGRREFLLATQLLLLLPISTLLRMRSPRHLATSSHGHRITQSPIVRGGAPPKKTCARFGTKKKGRNKCITEKANVLPKIEDPHSIQWLVMVSPNGFLQDPWLWDTCRWSLTVTDGRWPFHGWSWQLLGIPNSSKFPECIYL